MTVLAPHLTRFLREHLPRERASSPNTISGYADTFMLLVRFAAERLKRRPSDLTVEDISPTLVLAFLDDIEERRGNSARTRNTRLAAIRSFFRYLEFQAPECLEQSLRMRAVATKRSTNNNPSADPPMLSPRMSACPSAAESPASPLPHTRGSISDSAPTRAPATAKASGSLRALRRLRRIR